jgi:hypothetical protein
MNESYSSSGYQIFRGLLKADPVLSTVRAEIEKLGRTFIPAYTFDGGSKHIMAMPGQDRGAFYRALRYVPATTLMACHPILLDLSKQLGLAMPAVMHSYNIRMDMPADKDFLFHWHQDSTYLLGSVNAVTYWIPLVPAGPETGTIAVIPGSHRNGVLPFRYVGNPDAAAVGKSFSPKDVELEDEPKQTATTITAEPGDVVALSQLLVHQSVPNASDRVRWTVQVRHADLMEPVFRKAGFPMGDHTNILKTDYLPRAARP